MRFHFIPVPDDVVEQFLSIGNMRVILQCGGKEYKRAIQAWKSAPHIVVSLGILREQRKSEGDFLDVTLLPDPEPEKIELGVEFAEVLKQDDEASRRFYAMTPGRQRSLASYITSAKRVETRIKRSLEMAHKLKTNTLYSDSQD